METHVMKLCCQGCGADLQVSDEVRFITCNYCQSKLEIVRDASVTHTRVLEKIERTTERIAGNLKVIELQNDLERLDREWEKVRQGMMTRGKDGHFYEPSTGVSVVGGIAAGLVGLFVIIGSISSSEPLGIALGLGIIVIGIGFARNSHRYATEFVALEERYQTQRRRMISMIQAERRR
jgi:hypothetical protein